MEIKGRINKVDLVLYTITNTFSRKLVYIGALGIFLYSIFTSANILKNETLSLVAKIISLSLVGLSWSFGYLILVFIATIAIAIFSYSRSKNPIIYAAIETRINENCIEQKSEFESSKFDWSAILKVKNYFFAVLIYPQQNSAIVLPGRFFKTTTEKAHFFLKCEEFRNASKRRA